MIKIFYIGIVYLYINRDTVETWTILESDTFMT